MDHIGLGSITTRETLEYHFKCLPFIPLIKHGPEQKRILQATNNYAIKYSKNVGFDDIAQNIEKYYGLSKGIQNHIDELTPKPQTKSKSYGLSL